MEIPIEVPEGKMSKKQLKEEIARELYFLRNEYGANTARIHELIEKMEKLTVKKRPLKNKRSLNED